jgi:glycerol-3-phosphate dehydrogenase
MSVSTRQFDLIIVGAGINGAGIARDAAMRGLRVLLLDKSDIGSGTTSFSTRLIHGGLRYLEHGELGLVRESLREREILLRIAPHLVRPIPILVPIYENARRGKVTIRTGMLAYDLLSFDKSIPSHRMLTAAETVHRVPLLNRHGLKGATLFYDAQVEFPERLVVENVIAACDSGASLATYSLVTGLIRENERITGVEFVSSGEIQRAEAGFVVNASGPWVDQVLDGSVSATQPLIGGTKGSHIVVNAFREALPTAIYVEAQQDARPFFIIPWNGNVLIGTTDSRFVGDAGSVAIAESEVDYLLNETNRVLPAAELTRDQILYSYSGVRPLPFTSEKNEQKITRRHFIREHPEAKNLVSIVGGKLTTYRSLAEECVDLISNKLGMSIPRSVTADVFLPGAGDKPHGSDALRQRLARIYGSSAKEILNLMDDNEGLAQPLNGSGDAVAAEVVFSFSREYASTLADCLLRRTMLGLDADQAIGVDERAAKVAQQFLGWSAERATEEVKNYRKHLQRFRF